MGTTQGIMKLASDGVIDIHEPVATYIPEFAENGKDAVTISDLLTHTSGLTPWAATYFHATNPAEVLDYIDKPAVYETVTNRRYSDFSFMTLGFVSRQLLNND